MTTPDQSNVSDKVSPQRTFEQLVHEREEQFRPVIASALTLAAELAVIAELNLTSIPMHWHGGSDPETTPCHVL